MSVSYKFISKLYGLLDAIYFRNNCNNPRLILLNKIPNNNSKTLEIATGTAKNIILLAKHKPIINIIGIDLSDDMLQIAQNAIEKENIKNIKLIKMDGIKLEFDKESFDFIIISLLLHELSENVADKVLKECHKVLKPDGKLYVIEWEYPKKISQKIIFSIIRLLEPLANKEFKYFMKKDFKEYFLKYNFQINTIEYSDYSKVIEMIKT